MKLNHNILPHKKNTTTQRRLQTVEVQAQKQHHSLTPQSAIQTLNDKQNVALFRWFATQPTYISFHQSSTEPSRTGKLCVLRMPQTTSAVLQHTTV